jgi:hypothetical protein
LIQQFGNASRHLLREKFPVGDLLKGLFRKGRGFLDEQERLLPEIGDSQPQNEGKEAGYHEKDDKDGQDPGNFPALEKGDSRIEEIGKTKGQGQGLERARGKDGKDDKGCQPPDEKSLELPFFGYSVEHKRLILTLRKLGKIAPRVLFPRKTS